MAYEKYYPDGWKPGPEGETSINHQALNHIEDGIKTHEAENAKLKPRILKGIKSISPYILPGWNITAPGQAGTGGDGLIKYIPIYLSEKTMFGALGTRVYGGTAGTGIEIRVYDVDENLMPNSQVFNFGFLDTSTAGVKEILSDFELDEGHYFIGIRCTGNPQLLGITPSNVLTAPTVSRIDLATPNAAICYTVTGNMATTALAPTGFMVGVGGAVYFRLK